MHRSGVKTGVVEKTYFHPSVNEQSLYLVDYNLDANYNENYGEKNPV